METRLAVFGATTEFTAPGNIASGRDTVIHGNVTFKELPKGAMGLTALGLLLLLRALGDMGDRTTTRNLTQPTVNELHLPGTFAVTALASFTATKDGLAYDVAIEEPQGA